MKHSLRRGVKDAIRLLIDGKSGVALERLKKLVHWRDRPRQPRHHEPVQPIKSLGDGSFLDRLAVGQRGGYDLVCHFDGGLPQGRCRSAYTVEDSQGHRLCADHQDVPSGVGYSSNVAEHYSAYLALTKLTELAVAGQRVLLQGDSMLVVKQLNGLWRVKSGAYVAACRLGQQSLRDLRAKGVEVDIRWVPRERNAVADELASGR